MTLKQDCVPEPGQWKVGLEIELLAPRGKSRKDLANAIASDMQGYVQRIFYPQSEFSRIDQSPIMENLTLGFDVRAADHTLIARCIDDLTLVKDLDAGEPAKADWYRILSDDKRFLNLAMKHCDASASASSVLSPLAAVFATPLQHIDNAFTKVLDDDGAPIAMCAPLPGERERPCELVTAPIEANRCETVSRLLELAKQADFTIPQEAATHIHFDGKALSFPPVLAALIRVFGRYRRELRLLVGTNPQCIRLGDWPTKVYKIAQTSDFEALEWDEAVTRMKEAEPVKYCDFNFLNLLLGKADKYTFEIRIFPGTLDAGFILHCTALLEAILHRCAKAPDTTRKLPSTLKEFVSSLPLPAGSADYWHARMQLGAKRKIFQF